MKNILYYIVYDIWYAISLLPLRVLYLLSGLLYLIAYKLIGYRTQIVRNNLEDLVP